MNEQNYKLFSECKAVVCDLDGTLYLDGKPFPESLEFLDKVIQSGRKLFYFTNNTSKSRNTYLEKITDIGFPIADENFITSADCADSYLRRNGYFPDIYLVGNRDLKGEFESRGYNCFSEEKARANPPLAVLLGFDTELNYEKIHCCYDLILQGVPYIATHADLLCPVTKTTFKPDVGSFMEMFKTATGGLMPKVVGKPHKDAVLAISERAQVGPEKIAFIGDRLYTDIRMAMNYNMVGVLVLSGETTKEMADASTDKPKLCVESIKDLVPFL
jgi:4-nitrophenyl phosphatase